MELVRILDCFEGIVCYNPVKYKVTDRATQPDVIGFGIAAATEALRVLSAIRVHCRKPNLILLLFLFQKIVLYQFTIVVHFRAFSCLQESEI